MNLIQASLRGLLLISDSFNPYIYIADTAIMLVFVFRLLAFTLTILLSPLVRVV